MKASKRKIDDMCLIPPRPEAKNPLWIARISDNEGHAVVVISREPGPIMEIIGHVDVTS
jgi:hypothetical protein